MLNNGFVVRELKNFGTVDRFDWWPPSHEDDLPLLHEQAFLHPVLDQDRYVASCMQHSALWDYFQSGSQLATAIGPGHVGIVNPWHSFWNSCVEFGELSSVRFPRNRVGSVTNRRQ